MRKYLRLVVLVCLVPMLMGCVARYGGCSYTIAEDCSYQEDNEECSPEDGKSQTFYASTGSVSYKNGVLKWVDTQGGDIQLSQVQVTAGIYTDQDLTADCSELCSFSIGGELCLENCCICGTSQAGKDAWIKECKIFAELSLCGALQAEDTVFYQNVSVNGNINAQKTHFEGVLQAQAEIIQFEQVCAKDIIVNPTKASYDPQVICLKNHTSVYGDIYFPSSRGKIVLDSTSHIYGMVYGGKIIKPCTYDFQ